MKSNRGETGRGAGSGPGEGLFRIAPARAPAELETARRLFQEYGEGLGIDLAFQDFAGELARWPGAYAPPLGALLLAWAGREPAGCVGLRPLEQGIGEVKRLYVRPPQRESGLGRRLAVAAIAQARRIGYGRLRLDTLPAMEAARALYGRLGFREIPPYRHNPIPGAQFMEMQLELVFAAPAGGTP